MLLISTKYRTRQEDPPANCKLYLPFVLEQGVYRLASVIIPNTTYNINEYNNRFRINGITFVMDPGFYSEHDFMTALSGLVSTAGMTAHLNPRTKRLSIYYNGQITIEPSELLGFNLLATGVDVLVGDSTINLSSTLHYNISIDGITGISQGSGFGSSFIVPISGEQFDYTVYEPNTFKQSIFVNENRRDMRIEVRDDDGKLIDLNGNNFIIVLEKE